MDMMDDSEKLTRLRQLLRRHANGVAAESMARQGLNYKENWGVSVMTLRDIARQFAPDHDFARYLYLLPQRELRLVASMIADPRQVSADQLGFWGGGVDNVEVAENLAFYLLSETQLIEPLVEQWLVPTAPLLLRYCALLTLGRMAKLQKSGVRKQQILTILSDVDCEGSVLLASALDNILLRLNPADD